MSNEDYRPKTVASRSAAPRSMPLSEWPASHRETWEEICRPGLRLRQGGAASRYAEVSREDFARRYGAFLGFLQRSGLLDPSVGPAAQVRRFRLDIDDCIIDFSFVALPFSL
jgi:hypothetical protein